MKAFSENYRKLYYNLLGQYKRSWYFWSDYRKVMHYIANGEESSNLFSAVDLTNDDVNVDIACGHLYDILISNTIDDLGFAFEITKKVFAKFDAQAEQTSDQRNDIWGPILTATAFSREYGNRLQGLSQFKKYLKGYYLSPSQSLEKNAIDLRWKRLVTDECFYANSEGRAPVNAAFVVSQILHLSNGEQLLNNFHRFLDINEELMQVGRRQYMRKVTDNSRRVSALIHRKLIRKVIYSRHRALVKSANYADDVCRFMMQSRCDSQPSDLESTVSKKSIRYVLAKKYNGKNIAMSIFTEKHWLQLLVEGNWNYSERWFPSIFGFEDERCIVRRKVLQDVNLRTTIKRTVRTYIKSLFDSVDGSVSSMDASIASNDNVNSLTDKELAVESMYGKLMFSVDEGDVSVIEFLSGTLQREDEENAENGGKNLLHKDVKERIRTKIYKQLLYFLQDNPKDHMSDCEYKVTEGHMKLFLRQYFADDEIDPNTNPYITTLKSRIPDGDPFGNHKLLQDILATIRHAFSQSSSHEEQASAKLVIGRISALYLPYERSIVLEKMLSLAECLNQGVFQQHCGVNNGADAQVVNEARTRSWPAQQDGKGRAANRSTFMTEPQMDGVSINSDSVATKVVLSK